MKIIREVFLKILLLIYKENDTMAVVYATLIIKGFKTIDDVPTIIRDQTREYLTALEVPGFTDSTEGVKL